MDIADGAEKKKRSRSRDVLLLIASSLVVAVIGVGLFWTVDVLQVSPAWVFGSLSAITLFLVVGWGYRKLFCSPAFIAFFAAWTLIHVAILLVVLAYLGFPYYIPIVVLELWVGYTIAIWQFGPPPDEGIG